MILVDTSVWIEFLRQNNESIELALVREMENGNVIALSPIFGELLEGA
jgi:predicted nucleic acid-binding protein